MTDHDPSDTVYSILLPPFEWCDIPAGRVTLEGNAGTFEVKPFKMAKYPITYAQFQVFIDATDGFHNPEWWEGLAADAKHKKQPGEQKWKIDDYPRENVGWYDAVAFTRWLSRKVGYEVRLPTEWEWQWAAQGPDGRQYPWGDKFGASWCNSIESGIGHTTPVTKYPIGEGPFHVMDMTGNVWEWCLNEYGNPGKADVEGDATRVVRGGSWDSSQVSARATYRGRHFPYSRSYSFGFRVVAGRPLSVLSG